MICIIINVALGHGIATSKKFHLILVSIYLQINCKSPSFFAIICKTKQLEKKLK